MNILYLADPNSNHDLNWIKYFDSNKLANTYILPRLIHFQQINKREISLPVIIHKPISDFSVLRIYRTLYDAWRIRKLIKHRHIDLIHILYAEPNVLWSIFRSYFRIPMIVSSRGTDVLDTIPRTFKRKKPIDKVVSRMYKIAFMKVDYVTCTSHSQLESILKFSGRDQNISIIRTGIDPKIIKRTSVPAITGKQNQDPFILFPRQIKPRYNHEFCLEAIRILPDSVKNKYRMVFVGKNSGDLEYQQVLEAKMKDIRDVKFDFLPSMPYKDIITLIKQASLVVMTPRTDGSSVTGMEVVALGIPLIVGPLDYDPEIFDESVVKLKSWSYQELSEKIENALKVKIKIPTSVNESMNRESNMNKLFGIYKSLVH